MPEVNHGISQLTSTFSVGEVVARLLSALEAKEIMVFAVVDHSGEAAKVGIKMPDTKLVIFGSPRAGTPVMLAEPDSALDLPLKILVAEALNGLTLISYNSPAYLERRYGLAPELAKPLEAIETIAKAIAA
jgi:uncharacterized protein (DUF302 family)